MLDHFRVVSLEGFGLQGRNLAVSAAGALLYYLKKNRQEAAGYIRKMSFQSSGQTMVLDAIAVRNLGWSET